MVKKRDLSFPLSLSLIAAVIHFTPVWYFDLWWQMADARWIAQHLAFPAHNDFAYTLTAAPYICHEWLSGMVFYGIYSLFSAQGLAVFCALAFGLFVLLFFRSLPENDGNPWTAWLFSLLFLFVAGLRFPLRPEMFSDFLMLAVCAWERRREPPPWAYLLVFALWSNFHGQFVCGLIYLFICLAAAPSRSRAWRFAAACLGTFLNPYGWRIYEVPVRFILRQNYEFGVLAERIPNTVIVSIVSITMILTIVAVFWEWRTGTGRKKWATAVKDAVLTLLFGLQTLKLNRLLVIFCIIAFPILYERGLRLFGQVKSREPAYSRVFSWALGFTVLLLRLPAFRVIWRQPLDSRGAPEPALRFMESIDARGKVFNSFSFGGYLQWRLYPKIKTFCDSRSLGSTSLLYEERDAHESPRLWSAFMDRYDADFAVIDWFWDGGLYPVELGPSWHHDPARSPYDDLFPRTRWALIYWDQNALIFARTVPKNRDLIRHYGLKHTEPLSWDYTLGQVAAGRLKRSVVQAELEEVRKRSGSQWTVDFMLRQLLEAKAGPGRIS